jgi:hypothetical protein
MSLRSELFTSDPVVRQRLEACLERDEDHIPPGSGGAHVSKIQAALFILLPGLRLPDNELSDAKTKEGFYGPITAGAVLRYKQNHKPHPIINTGYQNAADNIVGKGTIQALDDDLFALQHPVDPPKPEPVDKSIRTLTLWLNAFIGKDVKNGDGTPFSFALTKGPHAGKSAIPGPFNGIVPGFDDCYLTDQRSFDQDKNASSRIHAEVRIDFTGSVPELTLVQPFGETVDTVRLRASTGAVLNTGRGKARGGFTAAGGFVAGSKEVTVRFTIAASNPVAKMPRTVPVPNPLPIIPIPLPIPLPPSSEDPPAVVAPDIDMIGEFTVDAEERTLKFRGLIDGFPFFEGYVAADGSPSVTIFQEPPQPGESPASGLPGPPHRVVDVDKHIP